MKTSLLITTAACLGLLAAGAPRTQAQVPAGTLIAGQNQEVGQVVVSQDPDYLYVAYLITELGWGITETHLEIAASVADVPQTSSGNPIPGQFTYQDTFEFEREVVYTIPRAGLPENIVIAAHAVVSGGQSVGICDLLPTPVTLQVYQNAAETGIPQSFPDAPPALSGQSYAYLNILDTALAGWHEGWCGKKSGVIVPAGYGGNPWKYSTDVYCPSEVPAGVVGHPENLGLIQYLINQSYIGTWPIPPYDTGDKVTVTALDIQHVVWWLLDGEGTISLSDGASYVLADVLLNGPGFQPTCGQLNLVVLVPWLPSPIAGHPAGSMAQPLLFGIPVTCVAGSGCETAWASGYGFCGRNWATYFTYSFTGNQTAADEALVVDCSTFDPDKCDKDREPKGDRDDCDDDRGPKGGKDNDKCDDDRGPKGGKDNDDCDDDRGPKGGKDNDKCDDDRGPKGGKDNDDCDDDRGPKGKQGQRQVRRRDDDRGRLRRARRAKDNDKCDDDRGPKGGKDNDDCDDDRGSKGSKSSPFDNCFNFSSKRG
ncbi:MAG: hypothetical protein H7A47_06590 [Verrucomicrobiales bacterium]|nr:hypothetical protein [Verrucomicrobiales bacterium]